MVVTAQVQALGGVSLALLKQNTLARLVTIVTQLCSRDPGRSQSSDIVLYLGLGRGREIGYHYSLLEWVLSDIFSSFPRQQNRPFPSFVSSFTDSYSPRVEEVYISPNTVA